MQNSRQYDADADSDARHTDLGNATMQNGTYVVDLSTKTSLWIELTLSSLTLFTNLPVLVIFLLNKHLQTPFTVYIISLLTFNLLTSCILGNPVEMYNYGVSNSWTIGMSACIINIYANWVTAGMSAYSYLLITVNRLWAIVSPVSYRERHTKRFAVVACLCVLIFLHLISLPNILYNQLTYFRGSACGLDQTERHQQTWVFGNFFIIFDVPVIVVVLAYPFILYKTLERRIRIRNVEVKVTDAGQHNSRESSRAFFALTVMTISLLMCWGPNQIYWTVDFFYQLQRPKWVYLFLGQMYTAQAVFDPVIFVMCLPNARASLYRVLDCGMRKGHK